ncbi:MAG: acyltransferase [Burkholderiaceae bacterium]|jgi:peptidoglycan/LPS O-acetylase OafA/YrhL|nr:acyltransferase [Burkholderiaceae bacterium]
MTNTRVNEIDLLRFIAALSVVFFHYSFRGYAADNMSVMPYPLLDSVSKYGYLGVELFFMISGFVILMTAASGSLRGFVISRIVRIYPAFWACCTITFAAIVMFGGMRYSASVPQYLINMTMLSGFLGVPSIDGAYWSLFVEIKFYALVAIVLISRKIHRIEQIVFIWLVVSIILEVIPVRTLRDLLITNYSAFFIAGATYFLIWSRGLSIIRIAIVVVSWGLAVFQSIKELRDFENHYHTAMSGQAVAVIITMFFIAMMLVSLRRTGPLGKNRWQLAGALTYPLYLLHQNIGFIIFNAWYPVVNAHLLFWGTIISAVALAYAVHIFVEKRFSLPFKTALSVYADRALRLTRRSSGSTEAP